MQHATPFEISNDFFSLHTRHNIHNSFIHMQMLSPILNTTNLPFTTKILENYLPSIHSSLCFNDQKLPFSQEVMHTEIGHLFEHILLEYIYQIKITLGHKNISVKGETSWNWYKNPTGFFLIRINIGSSEKEIFLKALPPSITLLHFIFTMHVENQVGVKSPSISRKNFTPSQLPRSFNFIKDSIT
jgi:hypothetical protein